MGGADDQAGWSVYAMAAAKDTAARDKARAAYQGFLTLRKDADPEIPQPETGQGGVREAAVNDSRPSVEHAPTDRKLLRSKPEATPSASGPARHQSPLTENSSANLGAWR